MTVVIVVRGASAAHDPPGQDGLAQLTASMLLEGAATLDGAALAERFEDLGTTVSSVADWDATTLSATVRPAQLADAVALLRDVLRAPAFPQRECDRLKAQHRAERLQVVAEPRALADAALAWICYCGESRYRRPLAGTTDAVDGLARRDIAGFWERRYSPRETTVIVAGDVTVEQAEECAQVLNHGWETAQADAVEPEVPARRETVAVHLVAKPDAAQCELRIGHVGVPRAHPDYFPLTVMNAILGGLFSSRINLNLRERHGYTYGAHSGFDWRRQAGPFAVTTAVNTSTAGAAASEILGEIDRIRAEEVTPDELSLATSYLAGVFPLRFETTAAVASALAMQDTLGLPDTYFDTYRDAIAAVTRADVRRAAEAHLHPEWLQVVAVGSAEELTPQLEMLGRGTVKVYSADEIERAP